jgi:hypothetical protein
MLIKKFACIYVPLVQTFYPLCKPGHSVLTEPIGSVLRFSRKFGSQKVRFEERTVRFQFFRFGSDTEGIEEEWHRGHQLARGTQRGHEAKEALARGLDDIGVGVQSVVPVYPEEAIATRAVVPGELCLDGPEPIVVDLDVIAAVSATRW